MAVSQQDWAYMRRIGQIKQELHAEGLARHQALPLEERLRRSWQLYIAFRGAARPRSDDDDPSPFYARARALGLYED